MEAAADTTSALSTSTPPRSVPIPSVASRLPMIDRILICDDDMPGMAGIELCRRVRSMRGYELLPIMLLTGQSDSASRIRGLEAGADEFSSKPIESEILIARIRSLLRVKHVTDQLERTEDV